MTVKDFLSRLEQLLADLPPDERSAALEYYTEYLLDACPEQDADACALLGTPEAVAADIRLTRVAESDTGWSAGYRGNDGSASYGQCLGEEPAAPQPPVFDGTADGANAQETAQETAQDAPPKAEPAYRRETAYSAAAKRRRELLPWLLLAVFTFPLWIGLVGGVIGVLCGVIGVVIAVAVAAVALVIGGFVLLVAAAPLLTTAFGSGLLTMGLALLAAAAGCVLLGLLVWLAGAVLPLVFQAVGKAFRWMKGRLTA